MPNADELACADAVTRVRRANHGRSRFDSDATGAELDLQDRNAILCEQAVARELNLYWTGCGKGSLGVADVGYFVEVRSVKAPLYRISMQAKDRKPDGEDRPMVICRVLEHDQVEIMGWDFVSELIKRGTPRDQDSRAPWWQVSSDGLRHLDELHAYVLEWLWSKA